MIKTHVQFDCKPHELVAYLRTLPPDETVKGDIFTLPARKEIQASLRARAIEIAADNTAPSGGKLAAIKWLRAETGHGLKECKEMIESWIDGGQYWPMFEAK
jgi:hypothetical protein